MRPCVSLFARVSSKLLFVFFIGEYVTPLLRNKAAGSMPKKKRPYFTHETADYKRNTSHLERKGHFKIKKNAEPLCTGGKKSHVTILFVQK